MPFRYDYSKNMMMKLFMARPDRHGGSEVVCNFEKALEIIKAVDNLTVHAPKIIYLVGWQYLGHDDKYPAFFEVNPYLKRDCDTTALESMLCLMKEAEKYNTVVSVHVNFTDAYITSPIFADYKVNKALIRNQYGSVVPIEKYNGIDCYKIDYKAEWNSKLFQTRVDKLLKLLPLAEKGTIHVDNFQCYVNNKPKVSAYEMQLYRKKMIEYLSDKGIDVTTEFTYREGPLTAVRYGKLVRNRLSSRYPIDLLNAVPAVWHVDKMTGEEIMKYYPHTYGGGLLGNEKFAEALYGNIHGEEIWMKSTVIDEWSGEFIKQFAKINLPFFYLNTKVRKSYHEDKAGVTIEYSDGTVSYGKHKEIKLGCKQFKSKHSVCLPVFWQERGYLAFSEDDRTMDCYLDGKTAEVFEVTATGLSSLCKMNIFDGKIMLNTKAGKLYFIKTDI